MSGYAQIDCINDRCSNSIYVTRMGAEKGGETVCSDCGWRVHFYAAPGKPIETFERSYQMIKRRDEEHRRAAERERVDEKGQGMMFLV